MTSWILGTTREPARVLVRGVAGSVIAAAALFGIWMGHIGIAIITIFWALVLMGPVLAWPLFWGPLIGRSSAGIGVVLCILPGYLTNNTPGDTAVMIAASIPFFLIAFLISFPQLLISLVQSLIRR